MTSWTDFNDKTAAPAATSLNLKFCTGWGQHDTHAEILSDGRKNLHKSAGTPYEGITGKEITDMLRNPPSVDKEKAQWFIPSTHKACEGRTAKSQKDNGEYWYLCLDEDGEAQNNLSLEEVDEAVVSVCGDVVRLIYSTRGSTKAKRKWRAIVPLWDPIAGADYGDTVAAFNALLIEATAGVLIPDPALEKPAQLIYLPNRGAHYEHKFHKADRLHLTPEHPIIAERDRARVEAATAEAEARKRREIRRDKVKADPQGNASVIEAFNANTTVEAEMERFGYQPSRNGRDWRSPNSSTGSYAVRSYGDFWISLSGSDAAHEIGNISPSGARIGDAFDLFAHYEHPGKPNEAIKEAAKIMDMSHAKPPDDLAATLANIGTTTPPKDAGDTTTPPPKKPVKKFSLIRADKLEFKEPDYLIAGLVEAETLALMFADPGSGKSFVALDIAACIATGKEFHGRNVKQGAVIYICGEGKNGIKRRLTAWEQHHGTSQDGAPLFVSSIAARFLAPDSIKEIVEAIDEAAQEAGGVSMIIVDTLNRNMGAGDESSTADMTAFISAVDAVKDRYEATALIVHHTGHGNKERARGSMAMLGALDAEYRIEKCENIVTMANTKMKEAATPPPLAFELVEVEVGRTRLGEAITSAALTETDAPEPKKSRLSPSQNIALEALNQFIADNGQPTPGGTGWPEPGSRKHVSTDLFMEFLKGKMTADSADSKRRTAKRAFDDLLSKGIAQTNAGGVWII